jgi:hypothetical protein
VSPFTIPIKPTYGSVAFTVKNGSVFATTLFVIGLNMFNGV